MSIPGLQVTCQFLNLIPIEICSWISFAISLLSWLLSTAFKLSKYGFELQYWINQMTFSITWIDRNFKVIQNCNNSRCNYSGNRYNIWNPAWFTAALGLLELGLYWLLCNELQNTDYTFVISILLIYIDMHVIDKLRFGILWPR